MKLSTIYRSIVCTDLFDGEHHDGSNDGHSYTGENAESTGTYELVGVLESLLEGAD